MDGFAKVIEALVPAGWLALVAVIVFWIGKKFSKEDALPDFLARIKSFSAGKDGISLELIAREAGKEAAKEEIEIELKKIVEQEIEDAFVISENSGQGKTVIWATAGRRPATAISLLVKLGYHVIEAAPESIPDGIQFQLPAVIVTNLRHGSDDNGGKNLIQRVKKMSKVVPTVIFTSATARDRREAFISSIGADRVSTNAVEVETAIAELTSG